MLEEEFRQEVARRKEHNKKVLLENLMEAANVKSYEIFKIRNLKRLIERAVVDGMLTDLYTIVKQ